jgi:hypothetical protein
MFAKMLGVVSSNQKKNIHAIKLARMPHNQPKSIQ